MLKSTLGYSHTECQRQRQTGSIGMHCDAWKWGEGAIFKRHNAFQWTQSHTDADARCVHPFSQAKSMTILTDKYCKEFTVYIREIWEKRKQVLNYKYTV